MMNAILDKSYLIWFDYSLGFVYFKKMPTLGALIVSLPLVSLLAIFWMWYDGVDTEKIAVHSESTFWFALPSMPLFLLFPWMLRQGWDFGPSILLCCLLTMVFI